MHVCLNAWFWRRPDVGSGQYTRQLVLALRRGWPELQLTLVAPRPLDDAPDGVGVQVIPTAGRWKNLAKVWFEQVAFPRVCAEIRAELVHVPYWASPLRSPAPVVVTVHDLIPLVLPAYHGSAAVRLYTGLVAASARGAAAVITDSEASRSDLLAHLRLPPDRVVAVPLAAGPDFSPEPAAADPAIRRKYDLPESYVLYLGGYDDRKNIPALLSAFTYVIFGLGDAYPLVLAGQLPQPDGQLFADIRAEVRRLELEEYVVFPGPIAEADKPALYRGAEVFAYPSRYEGFGLPLLEAMACGTPVVAADASSLPEVVGGAGFLVNPSDTRHMGGAILAILNQPPLRENLSQRSLAQAAQFSWGRTAAETVAVYERALRNRRVI